MVKVDKVRGVHFAEYMAIRTSHMHGTIKIPPCTRSLAVHAQAKTSFRYVGVSRTLILSCSNERKGITLES
jgi:hypothetical protein